MNKLSKIAFIPLVLFLSLLVFSFGNNKASASSSANDKPYYTGKVISGLPPVLQHHFKSSDGSYFKGGKTGFDINDAADSTSLNTDKIKSQLFLYKKGGNLFVLKSHGDVFYVVFNGSPKNIKKLWVNFRVSGIDMNYGTSTMTRVK